MILLIDNYDSFTYNLVQYFGELKQKVKVVRNDKISIAAIKKLKPDYLVISPGPCTPKEAGMSCEIIETFAGKIPILGVCLGHQCIGAVFGGEIIRADKLMHGKTSAIFHDRQGIFKGLSSPFDATRYHSLVVQERGLPQCLKIIARSEDGMIMAMQHRNLPIYGVQFHPESILTKQGKKILENFLNLKGQK
ncbi:MAG: aminodeoxychorismate/anthranilate synthase component II [Candidatus Omnitrophica bacterium]|nr:aminodeoxychorismate/anthranilate synthase component II [Candidatus Omnitrophota bacterium]